MSPFEIFVDVYAHTTTPCSGVGRSLFGTDFHVFGREREKRAPLTTVYFPVSRISSPVSLPHGKKLHPMKRRGVRRKIEMC
jgi:hypothetical protein